MGMLSVNGGKCVHGLAAVARCRACADACPCQAWHSHGGGLDLDPDKCDGCGLCLPACPTGALSVEPAPALPPVVNGLWRLRCEKSAVLGPVAMPCIHAVSEAQLLQAYQQGARQIRIQTGNCDTCYRGMAHRLHSRLEAVNASLRARALAPMAVQADAGAAADDSTRQRARQGARQGFWARLFQRRFFAGQPHPGSSGRAQALDILDQLGTGPGLWSMELDAQRCDGCSACVRLCPEHALNWRQVENWLVLHLDPAKCVGCRLCADVCGRQAVVPQNIRPPIASSVLFMSVLCSRCGVGFHLPLHEIRRQGGKSGVHFCPSCRSRVPRPHGLPAAD